MRDQQVATFLLGWTGFTRGTISSDKPYELVTLSEILEFKTSEKYYLSPKACAGILRRAAKRGKALPVLLHRALSAVAGALSERVTPEGKTPSSQWHSAEIARGGGN